MAVKTKQLKAPATKHHLAFSEIRDDVVLMRDGTARAVLLVSSINFALKSQEEQEAIVQAYMMFLNGLEFPVQIVIQSRRMNIDAYLTSLAARQKETGNDLLRAQIEDYRSFVQELVELGEIMQKRFYAIIPYDPLTDKKKNFWTRMFGAISPIVVSKLTQKQWQDRVEHLARRTQIITGQLSSMGLEAVRLDTQGLIELLYNSYNPDVAEQQKLADVSALQVA